MSIERDTHKDSKQPRGLDAKKAAVMGGSPGKSSALTVRKIIAVACVLSVVLVAVLIFSHSGPKNKTASAIPAALVDGELVHPVAMFADGLARHFVFKTEDGVMIRYFVLQTPDGKIRTAFDACDVCWQANKGYAQDGDVMICRNCNMRFDSRIIGEVRGGCNPAPLNNVIRQGNLVIRESDALKGRHFFDFGTRGGRG